MAMARMKSTLALSSSFRLVADMGSTTLIILPSNAIFSKAKLMYLMHDFLDNYMDFRFVNNNSGFGVLDFTAV